MLYIWYNKFGEEDEVEENEEAKEEEAIVATN